MHTRVHYRVGVFTLTAICGLIDAACFLALGGVFAELMTGNLLLLAWSIGLGVATLSVFATYLGAIVPFCLGAVSAGFLTNGRYPRAARIIGYPVECAFVVAATGLAWILAPTIEGPMIAGLPTEGVVSTDPAWDAICIVALLAFAMGIHNALMRRHGVPDVATNVMTLTLAGLLAESPLARGRATRWKLRLGSISLFVASAALGAFLVRIHVALPLTLASVLFVAALYPLIKGRPEAEHEAAFAPAADPGR